MITEIFVDMDGVLSDFDKKFREVYNTKPKIHYPHEEEVISNYKVQFRNFVADGYFAMLDPMPDMELGLSYLRSLKSQYNINISILTSTAREEYIHDISAQKKKWLIHNNIEFYPVFVPGKHLKMLYSKPGRILIDDTTINITDWSTMGGIGIKHVSWDNTIQQLSKYFNG